MAAVLQHYVNKAANKKLSMKLHKLISAIIFFLVCFLGAACGEIDYEEKTLPFVKGELSFEPLNLPVTVYKPKAVSSSLNQDLLLVYDDIKVRAFKVYELSSFEYLFQYPEEGDIKRNLSFIDGYSLDFNGRKFNYLDYPFYREVVVDKEMKTFDHKGYFDTSLINFDINSFSKIDEERFMVRNNLPSNPEKLHLFLTRGNPDESVAFGDFPVSGRSFSSLDKERSFHRYRVVANKEKNRILVFFVHTPTVHVYDYDGKLVAKRNFEKAGVSIEADDKIIYFESPVVIGDEVYVVYYGRSFNGLNNFSTSLIPDLKVFDWEGKSTKEYKVNYPIFKITEASNNSILAITYDDDNPTVICTLPSDIQLQK